MNELLAPPWVDKSPGAGVAPRESAAGGCGCRLCRGGSCNPSPPSAPPPSPSESWERFWFLGSWATSCREHKWQLALGACWLGKGNRYGRVRVRPWRGAGLPAQRVPASCSWADCFHGRVWVTWASAQGAARSGCPRSPQTSGCGCGGEPGFGTGVPVVGVSPAGSWQPWQTSTRWLLQELCGGSCSTRCNLFGQVTQEQRNPPPRGLRFATAPSRVAHPPRALQTRHCCWWAPRRGGVRSPSKGTPKNAAPAWLGLPSTASR